ncbi:MAG: hypothetical protein KDC80_10825 [Saprospiraceae bacterium]|nr:hypothetical protein [Saprospiraceae bacterium]
MNRKYVIILLAGLIWACGQDKTTDTAVVESPVEQPASQPDRLDPENMKEQGRELFGEKTVNTDAAGLVDVETLKGMLPATLNGMTRAQLFGEAANALGFDVVEVSGVYTTSKGENLSIDILDTGGNPSAIGMLAGWAKSEVDRQTPNGHEKTSYVGDQKVLEKHNPATNRSELATLVNMRYVIKLRARQTTVEELKNDLTALGLNKFDDLQ